ncbi:hypothetical protein [Bifidobacterium jacchi]|uniref:Uncharacterized protein n=1 Tax=Bifidobacterium jacchi TaxID=2490545 RepID=A0A5N5RD67_9BIFI|nr:hypothetical protein [Bifidobacterium jacchi]KAB5604859.1 hypothetical protein EHS19_09610 [Bifidobacterium jacchi]
MNEESRPPSRFWNRATLYASSQSGIAWFSSSSEPNQAIAHRADDGAFGVQDEILAAGLVP